MKTMAWTLENGHELRVESDGDEVMITIPNTSVRVVSLEGNEVLVNTPLCQENGARLVLDLS